MDTFGNAVVVGIQTGLQKTFVETLKTTIIPSYERTSEELFRQIQHTFMQGTKSCKFNIKNVKTKSGVPLFIFQILNNSKHICLNTNRCKKNQRHYF